MDTFFFAFAGCIVTIVYSSFFEWTLHRFVMHKPVGSFDYAFKAHAVVHHGIFKADHTYHLIHEKDKKTIPMAWWNGIVLAIVATLPFVVAGSYLGRPVLLPVVAFCTIGLYYGTYEYIHWCMHLPKKRRIEKMGIFYGLNGHHVLHHRYMHKNFNVVLPLADFCLGTLLLRSGIRFNQVKGPSVPNVQPQTEEEEFSLSE